MNVALTAERIELINGILNGTTNYIITKMAEEGSDFDTCLKEAQEKGYAERNPEANVEGYDACRKIAILSSLMTGKTVRYEDIYTEGITKITKEDFLYAKKMNKFIKLLAGAKEADGEYYAMVAPFMMGKRTRCTVSMMFLTLFLSEGIRLGANPCITEGAQESCPRPVRWYHDVIDCAKHET